jgi:hypothetical protein
MKTYNRPIVQVIECVTTDMLMAGNVSGGSLKGVHQGQQTDPIVIY